MQTFALVLLVFAVSLRTSSVAAQDGVALPTLYTNEQFVADVTKSTGLEIEDVKGVFAYVLGELPDRVRAFPTENYYYFYFYQGGIKYAGNIRFDVEGKEKGLLEFIYFKATTDWFEDNRDYYATLGDDDGVTVEKIADLVFRVSYDGKSVIFELNDLSNVTPPENALGGGETFLGPVFDESGIRFFLTFDETLKVFHYVLDETVAVADELMDVRELDHIQIGRRTSFAFMQDPNFDRKLLVGVFEANIALNNYLDGPFDQLPDNFLHGDELRRALRLAYPDRVGEIDRLGISPDGQFREKIGPYVEYIRLEDLVPADRCAAEKDAAAIYLCLNESFSE